MEVSDHLGWDEHSHYGSFPEENSIYGSLLTPPRFSVEPGCKSHAILMSASPHIFELRADSPMNVPVDFLHPHSAMLRFTALPLLS